MSLPPTSKSGTIRNRGWRLSSSEQRKRLRPLATCSRDSWRGSQAATVGAVNRSLKKRDGSKKRERSPSCPFTRLVKSGPLHGPFSVSVASLIPTFSVPEISVLAAASTSPPPRTTIVHRPGQRPPNSNSSKLRSGPERLQRNLRGPGGYDLVRNGTGSAERDGSRALFPWGSGDAHQLPSRSTPP